MSDESGEPRLKRKRISVACNSCRAKKAKCDGQKPICGRCAGYDYECQWSDQTPSQSTQPPQLIPSSITQDHPSETFVKHRQLMLGLCSKLSQETQEEVKKSLASVENAVRCGSPPCNTCTTTSHEALLTIPRLDSRKFVGEISDIHFLNLLMTQLALPDSQRNESQEYVDTYDPEEVATSYRLRDPMTGMPPPHEVAGNLNTYFSTIHIAYPFVQKFVFMRKVESIQKDASFRGLTPSWFSLLYALLAIGSFYNSFCQDDSISNPAHRRLFERSFVLSSYDALERSTVQVSALLAQCFYMLATSQIDRCWASLGIAIRLSQSIGLHAKTDATKPHNSDPRGHAEHDEVENRIWYCLYVLDRLMALQLGRPPAISDQDCHTPLPGRMKDVEVDCNNRPIVQGQNEQRHASEYFARMVEFSSIIGRVLRETYHPRKDMASMLQSTKHCDQLLIQWRSKLPRFLRFDMGHVFDQSLVLRRQRNMLAIKFHHLRTLIHRPYLCFPWLRGQDPEPLQPDQHAEVQQYGKTCTLEAQAIAHLMHNVSDTMDIVMNYPWWQMISCLVCAASVMILTECCDKKESSTDARLTALHEDSETCMEVLTALSNGSTGARLALKMLKGLREKGARISDKLDRRAVEAHEEVRLPGQSRVGMDMPTQDPTTASVDLAGQMSAIVTDNVYPGLLYSEGDTNFGVGVDDGRSTVVPDSMNWPLEFLNMLEDPQNPFEGHTDA
ncbi:hypothetical protein PFICI_09578 [Pestalotiopsis fici W106-1]|uniref:Zn(2)-C6 fungal-type domain-containing protein n=1 Tax=Pestalotiopsis fici (strain W106-1 / CGMCC3.15140) TaxID=1229662 RepID=W3X0Z1_PESFW|nr:uncharacterized protein PFICI_09578 [Pestalotiopsis fici W106-1]ETS79725.1 hypothetical protein PFICI_09578 [Pestalotiopsis fici W106-1]